MILKLFFYALVLVIVNASFSQDNDLFKKFKSENNKIYSSPSEESERFKIFQSNLRKIETHNSQKGLTWKMAVTQFADLTEEQFKNQVLGNGYIRTPQNGKGKQRQEIEKSKQLPDQVDWRDAGVISEVKNQGSCGSCWAFATTAQIESYAAMNNVSLTKLSAQEVTTCTPNPLKCGGTGGCRGSIPQLGYNYVQLFGLATNEDYPYWSGVTGLAGSCKYDVETRTPLVGISGYDTLAPNDMNAAMEHIANVGPLAIASDATRWQLYGHGVFSGCDYQENINLNHAIQLVGYGTDEELGDYWLVRNSWGDFWGENGYIRMQRESEPVCGMDSTPMQGTACQEGPGSDSQEVCGMCGLLYDMSYPLGAGLWTQPGSQ